MMGLENRGWQEGKKKGRRRERREEADRHGFALRGAGSEDQWRREAADEKLAQVLMKFWMGRSPDRDD